MCRRLGKLANELNDPKVPSDVTIKAMTAWQDYRRWLPKKVAVAVAVWAVVAGTLHPGLKIDSGVKVAKHEVEQIAP